MGLVEQAVLIGGEVLLITVQLCAAEVLQLLLVRGSLLGEQLFVLLNRFVENVLKLLALVPVVGELVAALLDFLLKEVGLRVFNESGKQVEFAILLFNNGIPRFVI